MTNNKLADEWCEAQVEAKEIFSKGEIYPGQDLDLTVSEMVFGELLLLARKRGLARGVDFPQWIPIETMECDKIANWEGQAWRQSRSGQWVKAIESEEVGFHTVLNGQWVESN